MRLRHPRFLAFVGVFAAAAVLAARPLGAVEAVIVGFDLAALVFILSVWRLWRADRPDAERARAARDDGGRTLMMLTVLATLLAMFLALGLLVAGRAALGPGDFAVVAGTLALGWVFANLVMAFHYAHLDHEEGLRGVAGAIRFPEPTEPAFSDFVYFAFTIGMTCQTADLDIASRRMRRAVTLHGVATFFFNLGVLALTVNVLAGVL